jgi:xylan 1,4-beta-xylosidase
MKSVFPSVIALAAILGIQCASAVDLEVPLTVDASKSAGRLKPLDGVNGQPIANGEPIGLRFGAIDATQGYRDARISMIRIHDSGAGDIDAVYSIRMLALAAPPPKVLNPPTELNANSMFLNPDADPDDPASYNFGPTDKLVAQIRATGAQPLFRLGRSIRTDADPPKDFARWAQIAAHVVMHYNLGWDNGFRDGIKYWEVWNEPDMSTFWQGQPEQYYELYAKVALAVKAADPSVFVGGPTQSLPLDERPYGVDFLAYVRDHHLPLDFYSWHWYAFQNDPYDFARLGQILRDRLDQYGFTKTTSIIDEWNSTLAAADNLGLDTAAHTAFITSALAYMQEAPIDQQAIYRADIYFAGAQRSREANALIAWGWMKDTPVKLSVSGTRTDGFTAVAGKSEDGKLVQVIVSNFEVPKSNRQPDPPGPAIRRVLFEGNFTMLKRQKFSDDTVRGYTLMLTGLSKNQHVIKRFRISKTNNLDLIETTTTSGSAVSVISDLAPSGVEVLQIRDTPQ